MAGYDIQKTLINQLTSELKNLAGLLHFGGSSKHHEPDQFVDMVDNYLHLSSEIQLTREELCRRLPSLLEEVFRYNCGDCEDIKSYLKAHYLNDTKAKRKERLE